MGTTGHLRPHVAVDGVALPRSPPTLGPRSPLPASESPSLVWDN
jgi:hypothetical protein